MAGPVYKLFLSEGFSEAWHQLSQEEKDSILAKHDEDFEKVGGKRTLFREKSARFVRYAAIRSYNASRLAT